MLESGRFKARGVYFAHPFDNLYADAVGGVSVIEAIWDWANNNEGGLALAVGLGIPVAAFLISFVQNNHLREELSDLRSRGELIARYSLRGQDAYFSGLERVVALAERIYGPKALSWRAYGTCLTIAFFYPLIAVMLGWVLFNIWNPAGIDLFIDTENGWERALRFAFFIFGLGIAALVFRNAENFRDYLVAQVKKRLDSSNPWAGFLSNAAQGLAFAGAFAFAGSEAALILFLYALLPILNAQADMVSLWVTRLFLKNVIAHRPHFGWVLAQLLVDLLLATLCLAALIALIIGGLTIWAAISPASVPLDWRAYWADVHADPRTGVALYIMALTTLVPTIIHVISGLAAMFTQKAWMLQPVVAELSEQAEPFSVVSIGRLERKIKRASFLGNLAACIAVAVLFIPPI